MLLCLPQGDSGGPLTIVDGEGVHILVGIISKRLGETCSEQDFAVFTSVSAFLPWIKSSIKENGGMASCSFNFSAPPSLGILCSLNNCQNKFPSKHPKTNMNIKHHKNKKNIIQENHWSLPLHLDSSCLAVNQQENNSPPSRPWALKIAQFPRFLRLAIVLDPSLSLPIRRSWLCAGVGGWGNQTPQIA